MSSVSVSQDVQVVDPSRRRRAVLIVVACTFIGATAQVLIKLGASHVEHSGLLGTAVGIFTVPTLFAGYCLYGMFTALLVYALRHAELSILYPVIALSYAWVTFFSVLIFHETMNPAKLGGVALIIAGVAVLGRGGSR